MKNVEMTNQEKQLLKDIYINEDRIDNGDLYFRKKTLTLSFCFEI